MSNDDGLRVWISDLDGYIDLGAIYPDANDEFDQDDELDHNEELEESSESLADLPLLSGDTISERLLYQRGLTPEEWTWAKHQAEHALGPSADWADLEPLLVKDLLSLGQRHAVARYAKWEKLFYPTALAATFPHGLAAIIDQFIQSQGLAKNGPHRTTLRMTLLYVSQEERLTAYRRTGMVRSAIHQIANEVFGPTGYLSLNISSMRSVLSLARLHFSVRELRVSSLSELARLHRRYEYARLDVGKRLDQRPPILGRYIENWEIRHLRPLTDLYPYSIRRALARGCRHLELSLDQPDRSVAVNELALARCEIILMKRNAKKRSSP